jgi:chlorite dismutase
MPETPPVPLTVEGSSVLHQMFRVRWPQWRAVPARERESQISAAAAILAELEEQGPTGSAMFSLLGHKGDLMLVHFRESFDQLHEVELRLQRLPLFDHLEPVSSYLSVVELGLYESTQKTYSSLTERGIEPFSEEWNRGISETLERQREAMRPRLFPSIPPAPYICFYPMDRRRGESRNWYQETMNDRSRMMHEHGMIGRRYAGEVRQIISGSIGFDDWEWGVDLFAEDPLVFKRLIYEMRFDEVSAVYALFGSFYVGRRCPAADLSRLLATE